MSSNSFLVIKFCLKLVVEADKTLASQNFLCLNRFWCKSDTIISVDEKIFTYFSYIVVFQVQTE